MYSLHIVKMSGAKLNIIYHSYDKKSKETDSQLREPVSHL